MAGIEGDRTTTFLSAEGINITVPADEQGNPLSRVALVDAHIVNLAASLTRRLQGKVGNGVLPPIQEKPKQS